MAEGKSSVGPVILVFGCLGLLVLSLAVAAVGGIMLAFRAVTSPSTASAGEAEEAAEPPTHRVVVAAIESFRGALQLQPGSECRFDVELVDDDRCRTAVRCGASVIYGGGDTNGYFDCTPSGPHVRGTDSETTSDDSDASMHIDTAAGILRVDDDGEGTHGELHLVATVLRVEPR